MKKLIIIFIIFFMSCENVKNYEKIEELRNTYILLNLPDKNKLKEICINSERTALNCVGTNTAAYLTILNRFYQTHITTTEPNIYCDQIINSPTMINGNFSYDAQRCHFQCNELFWNSIDNCNDFTTNINLYSNCLPGIWITNCNNPVLKGCLQNCFLYGDPVFFIPNP